MKRPRIAILHYTAPPVVGGVEAVILAHAQILVDAGYPVTVVAGQGEAEALPEGVDLVLVPEIEQIYFRQVSPGFPVQWIVVPFYMKYSPGGRMRSKDALPLYQSSDQTCCEILIH